MTGINIRVKHEQYSDVHYFTPVVSVENMCTIENYEFDFLQKLTQWVNDYWKEVEKDV